MFNVVETGYGSDLVHYSECLDFQTNQAVGFILWTGIVCRSGYLLDRSLLSHMLVDDWQHIKRLFLYNEDKAIGTWVKFEVLCEPAPSPPLCLISTVIFVF